jgi:hypothetical protein
MPLTWMKGHPGDIMNAENNDWGSSGRRFKSCQPDHEKARAWRREGAQIRARQAAYQPNQELWLRARIMNEQWILSLHRTCVSQVVAGEAATVQGSV